MVRAPKFVTRELLLALAGAVTGVILLSATDTPLASWLVGVGAAVAAATTLLVADHVEKRHAAGLLAGVGVAAAGLLLFSYPPDIAAVGAGIVGMNVGWALERTIFGVVRPVPEPRLARERA